MRLAILLKRYRIFEEINQRDFAAELGISASTLCRIERGEEMDGNTLAKILTWMLEPYKGIKL